MRRGVASGGEHACARFVAVRFASIGGCFRHAAALTEPAAHACPPCKHARCIMRHDDSQSASHGSAPSGAGGRHRFP
ncbi:hypothetical protein WS91_27305 [Burkholderia sp. MSMB1498]|nr:hypothetical protein WS91_27305 [Burkholderia sp. MSMB1498]